VDPAEAEEQAFAEWHMSRYKEGQCTEDENERIHAWVSEMMRRSAHQGRDGQWREWDPAGLRYSEVLYAKLVDADDEQAGYPEA
jgi:hypothetical protein